MFRRYVLLLLALMLALLLPAEQAQADLPGPDERPSPLEKDGTICNGPLAWENPGACLAYSLAITAAQIARLLPYPLPRLDITAIQPPQGNVTPFTYAQVIQDNTPVYGHPAEAASGLPPKRSLGIGYIWVSVHGKTNYEGRDYYQINADEYVPAEALRIYQPSRFQGVVLDVQPERPFAWILTAVKPLLTPGGDVNANAPAYTRYELVQIFATEHRDDNVWYLIGPDQWINQIYVGKVAPSPRPAGVESGAAWIDIDLFEQTLAAYVGDRMVYATLVSSGLRGWNTPTGLFQVWLRVTTGKMSGAYGRPDYYVLEDVPWSLYFNRDIALHGAYWHDSFGYPHSHGCVNLAPLDAKWLFEWAPETTWVQVRSGQESGSN
jgi:hypothetical protein